MPPAKPAATRSQVRLALVAGLAMGACPGCATGPRVVQDLPRPAQRLDSADVRLDWHIEDTAGEEFAGYQVQIAADPEFKALELDRVFDVPPAEVRLAPGQWFWRVRGRFKTVGDRIRETQWSDVHFVGGRYVRKRLSFEVAVGGQAPEASLGEAPEAPGEGAPAGGAAAAVKDDADRGRLARQLAGGEGPKVVPAHDTKPPLADISSMSVAPVRTNGRPDEGLTREVVLRLYQTKRAVLLEGSFFREDQVFSLASEMAEALAGVAGEGSPQKAAGSVEREHRFVLDPSQPTAMLPPDAVRLARPDAVLLVRLYNLDVDPASLPKPPGKAKDRAGMIRFEDGIRVLNATLVVMATGEIAWTSSLYCRIGVSDLTLVEEMVRRYFR